MVHDMVTLTFTAHAHLSHARDEAILDPYPSPVHTFQACECLRHATRCKLGLSERIVKKVSD